MSISFKSWLLFCGLAHQARIISRVSPAFLQQFLESFHNFAFLRTDGAGTSPPPCSKLLAQYVCCCAVIDTLLPRFMEKHNSCASKQLQLLSQSLKYDLLHLVNIPHELNTNSLQEWKTVMLTNENHSHLRS